MKRTIPLIVALVILLSVESCKSQSCVQNQNVPMSGLSENEREISMCRLTINVEGVFSDCLVDLNVNDLNDPDLPYRIFGEMVDDEIPPAYSCFVSFDFEGDSLKATITGGWTNREGVHGEDTQCIMIPLYKDSEYDVGAFRVVVEWKERIK